MYFKIKRTTKLSKLQGAYANKVGKDVGSIRYVCPSLWHAHHLTNIVFVPFFFSLVSFLRRRLFLVLYTYGCVDV